MNRFNELAQIWDLEPRRLKTVEQIFDGIQSKIKFTKEMNVADIGTGTGLLLLHIQPFVKHITGFDNSETMLTVFEEKVKKSGFENVSSKLHNADNENLPESEFDLVVSSMTFHHIENTYEYLKKVYSALKPGGEICIADLESEDGTFHSEITPDIHHFGFDKQIFEDLMEKTGFQNCETKTICYIERENKKYPIFMGYGKKKV